MDNEDKVKEYIMDQARLMLKHTSAIIDASYVVVASLCVLAWLIAVVAVIGATLGALVGAGVLAFRAVSGL